MQYGSGIMKEIEKLAARKGYRRSLQDYLREIGKDAGNSKDAGLELLGAK
jgi:hypothetical protein